jgi:hypothetical protein
MHRHRRRPCSGGLVCLEEVGRKVAEMTEKITTYLAMGVLLALIVRNPQTISNAIVQFSGGISSIVGGILPGG